MAARYAVARCRRNIEEGLEQRGIVTGEAFAESAIDLSHGLWGRGGGGGGGGRVSEGGANGA